MISMDVLGSEIFSTLWMKEQVLHRKRAHLKAPNKLIDIQQTVEKENNDRIPFTLTFHLHNHAVKYKYSLKL